MTKLVYAALLACFSAALCFGQKTKTPAPPVKPKTPTTTNAQPKQQRAQTVKQIASKKPPAKNPVSPAVKLKPAGTAIEISENDWTNLTDALTAEDWDKSSRLARQFIGVLKAENEKKQRARLRYFYLYSLAGKIFKLTAARDKTGEIAARDELKKAVSTFSGEEFVLPPRQFLGDCRRAFNFICTVAGSDRALRTTATGKSGLGIHSFEYVLFDRKIGSREFTENKTFLGGVLKKAEFNENPAQPWIMRLVFNKGFARIIVGD